MSKSSVLLGLTFVAVVYAAVKITDADHPATARTKASPVTTALYACKNWTRTHSRLAVDEFVDEYQITGKKLPANRYRVGLKYRSKGSGVLMASACEYDYANESVYLVKAESGLSN
jgi:hypothetical protein